MRRRCWICAKWMSAFVCFDTHLSNSARKELVYTSFNDMHFHETIAVLHPAYILQDVFAGLKAFLCDAEPKVLYQIDQVFGDTYSSSLLPQVLWLRLPWNLSWRRMLLLADRLGHLCKISIVHICRAQLAWVLVTPSSTDTAMSVKHLELGQLFFVGLYVLFRILLIQ